MKKLLLIMAIMAMALVVMPVFAETTGPPEGITVVMANTAAYTPGIALFETPYIGVETARVRQIAEPFYANTVAKPGMLAGLMRGILILMMLFGLGHAEDYRLRRLATNTGKFVG